MDEEEQELRGLVEWMGQVRVQENEHETTREEGDDTNKDRRKQIRKANAETKKRSLRKPAVGKAPALSHDDGTHTRPQQCDATVTNEQPAECQPSPPADTQRQREGDPGGSGDEDAGPAEEEQVAQSFVIVEQCRD